MPNTRRATMALCIAILALVTATVSWFQNPIYDAVRPKTATPALVGTTPTTVTSAYATQVAKGTVAPTATLVYLTPTCPVGQLNYHKRLFGDEGAPMGGYVTMDQWSDVQGCYLEIRRYHAEGGLWYYAAIIDDNHRTTPVLKFFNNDGTKFLVVRVTADYKLLYSVEDVR